MLKFKDALEEYIKIIYSSHKLTLDYLDSIVKLPSVYCAVYSKMLEGDNPLLKVYRLNGYMKERTLRFYKGYVKDLDVFINDYCKKNKIDKPVIFFDMAEFIEEVNKTVSFIEKNLDTKPILECVTDHYIIYSIKDMFDCIDNFMSLDYKIRSIIDDEKLDLQIGKNFRMFRTNELYYKSHSLIHSYPKSGIFNVCKTFFTPTLNKLTEGKDSWFDEK